MRVDRPTAPQTPSPIAAPTGEVYQAPPRPVEPFNLREVAAAHRLGVLAALGTLFIMAVSVGWAFNSGSSNSSTTMDLLMLGLILLLALTAIGLRVWAVVRLGTALRINFMVLAILLSLCSDLLALIMLIIVNKQAKQKLRAAGIRVGFWGAKASDIPVQAS